MSNPGTQFKKGGTPWNKGLKRAPEMVAKGVETRRKNGSYVWSKERRIVRSEETRREKSVHWKGGLTEINYLIRHGVEYRLWREAVFKRDNYTCQGENCGKRGGRLHADHIKPFSLFPELRFAIDNGRTLCIPCHKKTPTFGGSIKNYICTGR